MTRSGSAWSGHWPCWRAATAPPSLDELASLRTDSRAKALAAYREAIEAAISRTAEAGEGGVAYRHLATLLELFSSRFEAAKERRSGIDFEDLQILAARLLERGEIGAAYRSRFSHLMVDEFQDTNRLQLRLIEALRGPGSELMTVGDELQSIYGFRHADLEVFREQRRAIAERPDAETMELSGNFRSRPEVIGAVNALGASAARRLLPAAAGRRRAAARRPSPAKAPRSSCCSPPATAGTPRASTSRRRPTGALLPTASPRPASSPRGCASWSTPECRAARWSCCCGPSPISMPTRIRWSGPGCGPTWSAVAATGLSSRSPTSARCWRRSPTRSTTRRCSAPSPPPPAGSPPTPSGCCGRRRARGATSGRRWSGRPGRARRSSPSPSAWRRSPRWSWRCCAASRRRSRGCASAARASPSPA